MCKHEWQRYEVNGMWNNKSRDRELSKPNITSFSRCEKCGSICYVNPETNKVITVG